MLFDRITISAKDNMVKLQDQVNQTITNLEKWCTFLRTHLGLLEKLAIKNAAIKQEIDMGVADIEQLSLHSFSELHPELAAQALRTAEAIIDTPPMKRKVSKAARERMSLAQKARWAKAAGHEESVPVSKKKRKISPEGRLAMSLAGKRRWAIHKKK